METHYDLLIPGIKPSRALNLRLKKKSDFIILLSNMHIEIMDHLKRFFFFKAPTIHWMEAN